MITIKNVRTLDDQTTTINIPSSKDQFLDANNLLLLPGVIDPHISCGPVDDDKWLFIIESAVRGGVTTLLDIPCLDFHNEAMCDLEVKKDRVEKRLAELGIPLRYLLYGAANSDRVDEIAVQKSLILGSIVLLTPKCLELDEQRWNRIFQLAAWEDFPVIINSRNENAWNIKDSDEMLLKKAIYFAEKQDTRLYVLNVATQQEIDLINDARRRSMLVYAETTTQHLFPLDGSKVDFLWEALKKGVIETIGSGYSSDTKSEAKIKFGGMDYDFLNPAFLLPMLLTAHSQGKISLENIVRTTRVNLLDVLKIERKDQDVVLVDMEKEKVIEVVSNGKSVEKKLKGWPVYTILGGEIFTYSDSEHHLKRIE